MMKSLLQKLKEDIKLKSYEKLKNGINYVKVMVA